MSAVFKLPSLGKFGIGVEDVGCNTAKLLVELCGKTLLEAFVLSPLLPVFVGTCHEVLDLRLVHHYRQELFGKPWKKW